MCCCDYSGSLICLELAVATWKGLFQTASLCLSLFSFLPSAACSQEVLGPVRPGPGPWSSCQQSLVGLGLGSQAETAGACSLLTLYRATVSLNQSEICGVH